MGWKGLKDKRKQRSKYTADVLFHSICSYCWMQEESNALHVLKKVTFCQSRDVINTFVDECKKLNLAKAEILNVVNIRPASVVEIFTGSPVFHSLLTCLIIFKCGIVHF